MNVFKKSLLIYIFTIITFLPSLNVFALPDQKNNYCPQITLILKEGLGNQLFQYATAYAIAKKNNYNLLIDVSYYPGYKYNEICGYNLTNIISNMNVKPLPFYAPLIEMPKPLSYAGKLFRAIDKLKIKRNTISQKNSFSYDEEIINVKAGKTIEGYFLNNKYFDEYRNEILDKINNMPLSEQSLKIAEQIQQEKLPTVSMQYRDYKDIRAGGLDNIKDNLGLIDKDYYQQAINLLINKFGEIKVFVFSNNIDATKKLFADFNNLIFIKYTAKNVWEDMKLMSLCNHNIIGNSTYGYWGAYLNNKASKVVIAPEQFFPWQADKDKDIYPKKWLILPNVFQLL